MKKLGVEYVQPGLLKANPNNANRHSPKQVHQIAVSISTFGNVIPILVDESLTVIAGHGRLAAAISLEQSEVPVIKVDHLSDRQKRALLLADNKIARNSEFDLDALRIELNEILSWNDDHLDIHVLGFDTPEVDQILDLDATKTDPLDSFEEPDRSASPRAKLGDLYQLGQHRLYCGDAKQPESYRDLLGEELADQVVTDPPYNLRAKSIGGLGKIQHSDFVEGSGELSDSQFQGLLFDCLSLMKRHSVDGAIIMVFMDWRHIRTLLAVGEKLSLELKNICVWVKNNGGMGSLYRSQHEFIAIFKNGNEKHVNNVELGKHGRYRTNVWSYAGANSFGRGRLDDLANHPTVKPMALIADAIKDCSTRDGVILDPFGGSGTTLLAAQRTGRRGRLIELDPHYVDTIIGRWEAMTGQKAVLLTSTSSLAVTK